jgi:hypothetical protein
MQERAGEGPRCASCVPKRTHNPARRPVARWTKTDAGMRFAPPAFSGGWRMGECPADETSRTHHVAGVLVPAIAAGIVGCSVRVGAQGGNSAAVATASAPPPSTTVVSAPGVTSNPSVDAAQPSWPPAHCLSSAPYASRSAPRTARLSFSSTRTHHRTGGACTLRLCADFARS